MMLKFKAISMTEIGADSIYREGRDRGIKAGEELLVFGSNIPDSQYKLDIIRNIFRDNKHCSFLTNQKRFFEVEIKK